MFNEVSELTTKMINNVLPEQVLASHFPARVEGRLEELPYTAVQSAVVGSVIQLFTAVRSVSSWTRAL